jgi:hypothetical protein
MVLIFVSVRILVTVFLVIVIFVIVFVLIAIFRRILITISPPTFDELSNRETFLLPAL